jgi:general secretion pathway protein D
LAPLGSSAHWCLLAWAFALICAATPPPAQAARPGARVSLNFPDTEVASVALVMAEVLGRPIAVDPRVKGKLTLRNDQPVTPAEAQALFSAALRGVGAALVDSGGLLRLLPEAEAKLQAGPVRVEGGRPDAADAVATQVFRLNHESATSMVAVLRPLISPNNTINANAGNNTLVITDYSSNLSRLGQLIAALDTPSATDVEVIPLQHALAADLAPTVQKLSDGAGGTAPAPGNAGAAAAGSGAGALSILADAHLNALLVRAPNPTRLAAVRALVARLDLPGAGGTAGSNVHVVYLKHAEATRLATVLRAAFSPDAMRAAAGGAGAASGGSAAGGSTGGATRSTAMGSALSGSSAATNGSTSSGAESSASTTPVSASAGPSTGGYIQADPASNALIITAPPPLFRELREVIELLDNRRAQLYVESLVVEVDASRALDVGLQWKQIFNISSSTELTLGTVAQAIESTAGTNILSTANLVTLDNEEAKIVVGQNVPFVTGSYTSTTSSSPFQTIERKDVGLTLRIRPQIGPNGSIRMTILQESSSVSSSTTPGTTNAGPTTNKRAIESTVVVGDGKIIVLGGLIEDSITHEASQLPLIGDIPVLGAIFRTIGRSRKKTNLMVFLRPVVMPDEAATDALSLDRYDLIRARQQALPADSREVLALEPLPLLPAPAPPGAALTTAP